MAESQTLPDPRNQIEISGKIMRAISLEKRGAEFNNPRKLTPQLISPKERGKEDKNTSCDLS